MKRKVEKNFLNSLFYLINITHYVNVNKCRLLNGLNLKRFDFEVSFNLKNTAMSDLTRTYTTDNLIRGFKTINFKDNG